MVSVVGAFLFRAACGSGTLISGPRGRCSLVGSQELRNSNGRRTDRCEIHGLLATLQSPLSVAYRDRDTIDYIWGVIDTIPETNFPDIRNRCVIHSESGSCMVIPREGDKVRLYIQLSDKQVVDPATGRVDKARVSPELLLQVGTFLTSIHSSQQSWTIQCLSPGSKEDNQTLYHRRPRDRLVDDLYQYALFTSFKIFLTLERSRPTGRIKVFRTRTSFYRR